MSTALALPDDQGRLITAALNGLSPNSRRVYTRHLHSFLTWLSERQSQLHREAVGAYLADRHTRDTSSYNQALSAIKRLANQAAEHGWLSWHIARSVDGVPARKVRGESLGSWLSLEEVRSLFALADSRKRAGKRDLCALALLIGCGLRRDELSRLTVEQYVKRGDRTMLADIHGKGNRVRTIGVPVWAESIVADWLNESGLISGPLVRSFKSDGRLNGALSVSGIWDIVLHYSGALGIRCTPHDLRRTYAKLAREAGAPIEVIQHSLGHSSVTTTEKYMNTGRSANAGDWINL